jgi:hypothetical protein
LLTSIHKWNVGTPCTNDLKWNEMLLILQQWMWNEIHLFNEISLNFNGKKGSP